MDVVGLEVVGGEVCGDLEVGHHDYLCVIAQQIIIEQFLVVRTTTNATFGEAF